MLNLIKPMFDRADIYGNFINALWYRGCKIIWD